MKVLRRRHHFHHAVIIAADIIRPGIRRDLHDPVFIGTGGKENHPDAIKQIGHRAVGAEIAAVLAEYMAHLADRAVAVVGSTFHQHRDPAWGVALVTHRLVTDTLQLAGPPLDGPVDGLAGHIARQGLVHRGAQGRVTGRIAATGTGSHRDLADQLGE